MQPDPSLAVGTANMRGSPMTGAEADSQTSFAEIVRPVPTVYDKLDPSSIPALLSCNRELRSFVKTAVTLVYAFTSNMSAGDIKGALAAFADTAHQWRHQAQNA